MHITLHTYVILLDWATAPSQIQHYSIKTSACMMMKVVLVTVMLAATCVCIATARPV